jgi:uncharacterized protein DUF4399
MPKPWRSAGGLARQTEAEVKLAPGHYKSTMQFANGAPVAYRPAMAASINVTVKVAGFGVSAQLA